VIVDQPLPAVTVAAASSSETLESLTPMRTRTGAAPAEATKARNVPRRGIGIAQVRRLGTTARIAA
jgi:hypothetical protein